MFNSSPTKTKINSPHVAQQKKKTTAAAPSTNAKAPARPNPLPPHSKPLTVTRPPKAYKKITLAKPIARPLLAKVFPRRRTTVPLQRKRAASRAYYK